MSELRKPLGLLAIVLIALALVLTLFHGWPSTQQPKNASLVLSARSQLPPPPSQAVLQQLQQDTNFQYLVSFTNQGFVPSNLSAKQGQTVRFTNNSTEALWVASVGAGGSHLYPGTSSCGGSPFDSCGALQPGQYWEFTFTEKGTWEFINNFDKSKTGSITVQ